VLGVTFTLVLVLQRTPLSLVLTGRPRPARRAPRRLAAPIHKNGRAHEHQPAPHHPHRSGLDAE
jgi:hypothetical protein